MRSFCMWLLSNTHDNKGIVSKESGRYSFFRCLERVFPKWLLTEFRELCQNQQWYCYKLLDNLVIFCGNRWTRRAFNIMKSFVHWSAYNTFEILSQFFFEKFTNNGLAVPTGGWRTLPAPIWKILVVQLKEALVYKEETINRGRKSGRMQFYIY